MKVIIYARSATAIQSKEDNNIKNQLSRLTDYAKKNEMQIQGVYYDAGNSGGVTSPGLQKLINDLKEGDLKAEKLLCTSTNRLSRSYFKMIQIMQILNSANVNIEFMDDLIDTKDDLMDTKLVKLINKKSKKK